MSDTTIADVAEIVDEATTVGSTDVAEIIKGLNNPSSAMYSSIKTDDFASRLRIVQAMTTSSPVDDHLGETINLTNFIVQPVDLVNATGEVNTAPRIVLIDADGTAYHATSVGLLTALRNVTGVLGEPSTWPEAVPIVVIEQKSRNGYKFFTINFR